MPAELNTEDVRFYATTNQSANHSMSQRQMEFAFDSWLHNVKKEAAATARREALDEVIAGVATSTTKPKPGADWEPLSQYDEGRNAGLMRAYNIAYDLKDATPPAKQPKKF